MDRYKVSIAFSVVCTALGAVLLCLSIFGRRGDSLYLMWALLLITAANFMNFFRSKWVAQGKKESQEKQEMEGTQDLVGEEPEK